MATSLKEIEKLVKELEKLNEEIIESGDNADDLAKSYADLAQQFVKAGKALDENADEQERLNAAIKEAQTLDNALIQTEAKIQQARSDQNKELIKRKHILQNPPWRPAASGC